MKHLIWSNIDLDLDDWKDDILAEHPDFDEQECWDKMLDMNEAYLNDERENLRVVLNNEILIIADIGRWNGRFSGYRELESNCVSDCLYSSCMYVEWFVEDGDLRCTEIHHDGRNYLRYRVWKDCDHDILLDKLYEGTATEADIRKYTDSIVPHVADVYGWKDE